MDYQEMYYKLFNRLTDAIHMLESIQAEAEELFISQYSAQASSGTHSAEDPAPHPQPQERRLRVLPQPPSKRK
jgi:hypothetical protein